MIMKRILSAAIALLFMGVTLCGAQEMTEQQVKDAVRQKNITVEITTIFPTGAPSVNSTDGYRFTIADGKIDGYLPYYGQSYTAPMPGSELGIRFDNCPIEISQDDKKAAKGEYMWHFTARTENDSVDVYLSIFTNGSASMSCNCTNRSAISYNGNLVTKEE